MSANDDTRQAGWGVAICHAMLVLKVVTMGKEYNFLSHSLQKVLLSLGTFHKMSKAYIQGGFQKRLTFVRK